MYKYIINQYQFNTHRTCILRTHTHRQQKGEDRGLKPAYFYCHSTEMQFFPYKFVLRIKISPPNSE